LHHSLLHWLFHLNLLLLHLFAQVGKLRRRLPRAIAMALGHDSRLAFDFTGTPLTPIEWRNTITFGRRNCVRLNMKTLFSNLSAKLPEELVETLLKADNVRIERIVSYGQSSPDDFWYDESENEWVALLKGAARLRFADGNAPVEMKPGDFVNISARQKHRVEWTTPDEPTIWLAIYYA
jgi:cupin 2 domain-containing protein